nr:RNase adapter RapZ [[Clostridium] polysaccharolyticum]
MKKTRKVWCHMRFVIVTGMSGAGKSSVLKMLEDAGYFCVDNLPIPLIPKLSHFIIYEEQTVTKAALGVDIRNGQALEELDDVLNQLNQYEVVPEILFLDSTTEVLVKRYKETRRNHPLVNEGRVDKGIEMERERLQFIKKRATYIIDTSHMLIRELKTEIDKIFIQGEHYNNFFISVVSFGFKYGILSDADLVFDVRFLPNPFYIPELKKKTGRDKVVYDYVMDFQAADDFLNKLEDMLKFLIPNYIIEGKNQLVIGIGCTGGKHRSVTIARAITERLSNLQYGVKIEHRDVEKDV